MVDYSEPNAIEDRTGTWHVYEDMVNQAVIAERDIDGVAVVFPQEAGLRWRPNAGAGSIIAYAAGYLMAEEHRRKAAQIPPLAPGSKIVWGRE